MRHLTKSPRHHVDQSRALQPLAVRIVTAQVTPFEEVPSHVVTVRRVTFPGWRVAS